MKRCHFIVAAALLLTGGVAVCGQAIADSSQDTRKIHHVVIVWLKQAGDDSQRRQYVDASKRLAELPGVLAYEVGTPAVINRDRANPAVDESYDVAVSSVFENRQAYEAFLKDPEYLRVAQQVLRPLVGSYKVYDFTE